MKQSRRPYDAAREFFRQSWEKAHRCLRLKARPGRVRRYSLYREPGGLKSVVGAQMRVMIEALVVPRLEKRDRADEETARLEHPHQFSRDDERIADVLEHCHGQYEFERLRCERKRVAISQN